MSSGATRRFLLATAGISALLSGMQVVAAEAVHSADIAQRHLTQKDFPRWQQLAPDVYAYEGLHSPDNEGTVVNTVSLIVVTTDGVAVIDGQGDVAQTKLLVDNVAKLTPQPIRYVVIASDHSDHVGGNAAFRAAFPDVVFIASPASQKTLAKNENPPSQIVADRQTLRIGKTDIEILNLGRAHTGGDLIAYLPATKVLFMGEVFLRDVFPAMRSAYPKEWLATITRAQAMNASWYVPGHGFIDDAPTMKAELAESAKAIAYVIAEVTRLHAAGDKCDSPKNCPAAAKANWGPYNGWALRSSQGPLAVARVYQEIEGKLAPRQPE